MSILYGIELETAPLHRLFEVLDHAFYYMKDAGNFDEKLDHCANIGLVQPFIKARLEEFATAEPVQVYRLSSRGDVRIKPMNAFKINDKYFTTRYEDLIVAIDDRTRVDERLGHERLFATKELGYDWVIRSLSVHLHRPVRDFDKATMQGWLDRNVSALENLKNPVSLSVNEDLDLRWFGSSMIPNITGTTTVATFSGLCTGDTTTTNNDTEFTSVNF